MKYCPKCGTPQKDSSAFCGNCGSPLPQNVQPQRPNQQQPQQQPYQQPNRQPPYPQQPNQPQRPQHQPYQQPNQAQQPNQQQPNQQRDHQEAMKANVPAEVASPKVKVEEQEPEVDQSMELEEPKRKKKTVLYVVIGVLVVAVAVVLGIVLLNGGKSNDETKPEEEKVANESSDDALDNQELRFETFADKVSRKIDTPFGPASYSFDYSIEWPVAGNPEVVDAIRNWIKAKMGDTSDIDIATMKTPEILINIHLKYGEEELKSEVSGIATGDINLKIYDKKFIKAEDKGAVCLLSYEGLFQPIGPRVFTEKDNLTINKSTGKTFSADMLKDVSELDRLIRISGYLLEEPQIRQQFEMSHEDLGKIEDLPNPKFVENGMEYYFSGYGPFGYEEFTFVVPYEEIIPLMSDEAIEFIPEEYLAKYYEDDGVLTEDIVKRLWWYGIPDHSNSFGSAQALSKDFKRLIDRGFELESKAEYGEGEVMLYWYTGQDGDDLLFISSVKIHSQDDTKAVASVEIEQWGNRASHDIVLIKEPRKLRNGKTVKKWVIDDYIIYNGSIKPEIQEFIDSQ